MVLLRHNRSTGCFHSRLQVICIVGCVVSNLLLGRTFTFLDGVQAGPVLRFIRHNNSVVFEQALVPLADWAGAMLHRNTKSGSLLCLPAEGHEML